jgi:hypothetical protein
MSAFDDTIEIGAYMQTHIDAPHKGAIRLPDGIDDGIASDARRAAEAVRKAMGCRGELQNFGGISSLCLQSHC